MAKNPHYEYDENDFDMAQDYCEASEDCQEESNPLDEIALWVD